MNFEEGDIVKIKKLSHETVEIALRYKKSSPLMVCPCDLLNKALKIESIIEDSFLAIVRLGESLSICKLKDLEKIS